MQSVIHCSNTIYVSASAQWCLVDLTQMNILLNDINCPYCDSTSLSLRREENRYGFCYTIVLSCSACDTQVSSTYSSRRTAVKQSMAIETNELLNVYMEEIDQRRITSANVSSSATTKRDRAGRWIRKRQEHVNLEADEGPSYAAGGF